MPTVRVELPRLHAAQREIVEHPARFRVVICGRRFGKTELAKSMLVRAALKGMPVAYFAPSYKLLSQTWRELTRTLGPVTKGVNNAERRIDLVTGGVLEAWSLDTEDVAVGRKYGLIVIDEAARVRHANVWPEAIRPTLTDLRGQALFISTPRGRNWLYALYVLGLDGLNPEWQSFTYPTLANPFMAAEEVESARTTLPDRIFRQEYLAEFLDDGGGVFRGVDTAAIGEPEPPQAGSSYVFGIDWGRHNDYTAISVIDIERRRQVFLDRFTDTAFAVQRGRIKALAERYRPVLICAETNSIGEPNIEALATDGLPMLGFSTTAQSKTPLIEALALAIERQDVVLLDDTTQTNELLSYEIERLPSGRYTYNAADGLHDDTVIALALAWNAASRYTPLIIF